MTITRHRMNYRPWFPHPKIIRTRGAVHQTALVVFWFGWVLNHDFN